MYAVIRTGGKQYRVAPGDVLKIEKAAADENNTVEFSEVLAVSGEAGSVTQPAGAKVIGTILGEGRGEVQGRRRFGDAALLIGERDYFGLCWRQAHGLLQRRGCDRAGAICAGDTNLCLTTGRGLGVELAGERLQVLRGVELGHWHLKIFQRLAISVVQDHEAVIVDTDV